MKHLSAVPEPPSKKRPDVPRGLDLAVIRALAKDPDDRFQSAEEMDAELARIEQGFRVSDETADAATAVLAGSGIDSTAVRKAPVVTTGAYRPPPGRYPPPVRRRPRWPWLVALLALAGIAALVWFLVRPAVSHHGPTFVRVPLVEGIVEALAVKKLDDAGLGHKIIRRASSDVPEGKVIQQNPGPGEQIPKGNKVTIVVSEGPPQVTVPNVVGMSESEAESLLQSRHLQADPHTVPNDQPEGTVVAQSPSADALVDVDTVVRINIATGPQPVGVPNEIGRSYSDALAELQSLGFAVRRQDVQSNEPAETVVNQSPAPNSAQPKGSTVTLKVSKGPSTTAVPDVIDLDQDTASATLSSAGFQVAVQQRNTTDPAQDGVVLAQNPSGGKQATIGSTVTIVIGVLVAPTTTTETTTTTPTTTDTTTTVTP
jgi:serine/threonine-protein kinase